MAINVYEIEMYTLILTYSILLECSIYSFSDQTRFSSTVIPCFSLRELDFHLEDSLNHTVIITYPTPPVYPMAKIPAYLCI